MLGLIIFIGVCICILVALAVRAYGFTHGKYCSNGYIIVPCRADSEDLERTVKAYYWEEAFENEKLGREIIIVIMERCTNEYIAKSLEQEYAIVKAVDISALEDYIRQKESRLVRNGKSSEN